MNNLDSIEDKIYLLVRQANKLAGYEKYKYNYDTTAVGLLNVIATIKEEFANDPETLKELEKLKYFLEGIVKKYRKYKEEVYGL